MKWFQHDSNARNDIKLKRLYRKYGSEGRDLYWQVVERIAEKLENTKTFILEETTDDLALEMGWEPAKVDAILNCCVDLDLFDRCPSTGKIRCLKILSRLDTTVSRHSWIKELINSAKRFTESKSSKAVQTGFELTSPTEEDRREQTKETPVYLHALSSIVGVGPIYEKIGELKQKLNNPNFNRQELQHQIAYLQKKVEGTGEKVG
jgi:hypothetical protein